ncbi:nidogen-2 isoform X3 [Kryptolebias marmoratus]|uniref:nidogen-2 isoform X3 n=1 Tax=Kryptolebias marmoratus TaxID=37003 RepID=UPI0007F87B63|nr:nidogen-2 isoform X3 [Kryptolebias marmoratus]
MDGGAMLAAAVLCWSCGVVGALHRTDLFPFGPLSGDLILPEGDDETSRALTLPKPFYFYDSPFSKLYVATNGIISAQDLPMEKQYVDDGLPTDFPVVAPFLADIDTSGGRGQIYYRVTETPSVLNRVAQEVHRGFPDAKFTPTHAMVATWENVAAYEDQSQKTGLSNKVNTFQAVIGYDENDSYVLFLYPEGGLNFFGTRHKESYNVKIELPARVGFSRGEVTFLLFSRTDGPFYSVTTDENSVKSLYQVGNTGIPGVWLFHTGSNYFFHNIVPASIGGLLDTFSPDTTTPEYEYLDNIFAGETKVDTYTVTEESDHQVLYNRDVPEPRYSSEPAERQYVSPKSSEGRAEQLQEQQPQLEVVDVHPPERTEPPLSPGGHVVSVDEDVDLNTGVFQYTTENKETCAKFQHQCSQNAFCSDYATGFCCHCRPGFYGNGRQCLPDGAPQRVSGKVSGTVAVGLTPVKLNNIDLHAYIVVGDGRAYTAISEVPEPVGWALMPVSQIGELFGWLFALELPNSQAGFKVTGAEFTRHADVLFYPGNQRLSIVQTGRGLDEHNHLTVDTVINGNVPLLPPGAEVTMEPFKELYQYYPSVITSTSVREYTVVSAERGSESHSFYLKQNITFRHCHHDNLASVPETLLITMERVFVMFVKEERTLRYAITNKISPDGADSSEDELTNPCYSGNHDCDTTAQCIPQEGLTFRCQCATGYRGDGQNCYDIDECAEGVSSCGENSQCSNLPGSHRCQCQRGFEFGYDRRTCVDIDECSSSPCHINARCVNELGSFQCLCQPGFLGDGFYCSEQTGRPKSQCEQHRDSLQSGGPDGRPSVGAYIPQCDSDGLYRPQQCHSSTGHCWCVDSRGQERPGTRTSPGAPRADCSRTDEPERPKTRCEHHRDSVQTTSPDGLPLLGAYVPQCDEHGQYQSQQCHGSTGYCWCVDSRGQERPGTRTSPGAPRADCSRTAEPERQKTQCEHHRDSVQTTSPDGLPLVGAYVPQCDGEGQYTPLQCHGSTGYCWCVDSRGQEKPGTRTPSRTPPVDCDKPDRPKTQCEHHRDSVQITGTDGLSLLGAYVPQCDEHGQYQPQQCHRATGYCWCVDSRGQEIPGTRTPPGSASKDCSTEDEPERPKTQCEHHRDSVQTTSPDGLPLVGAYVPQCDEHGQYQSQQCHGSTGYCWCVDSRGQERPGTRTPPGSASKDCSTEDEPERPKTQCEHHRDSVQTTSPDGLSLLGAYVPQCDEHGQYQSQQCHGSTGHCWCVDSRGQERPGTRTSPGAPRVDCSRTDEPERPKTRCEHHRDSVQTTSPDGLPLLGAYVPQCDEHGQYQSQQCHGSTGYCWCVDSRGQERPGTRTSPGSASKDCSTEDEPERPKTQCEHHRDSVQTTSPDGLPLVGAYVPQCDEHGQYQSQQCHSSTGHCWCVDSRGQERPGTRTSPGAPRADCSRTDQPERPKTSCERHKERAEATISGGYPIAGAYVPQCDADGHYIPLQCYDSTGHCWCVDRNGQERSGTRTPPGTPPKDCDKSDRPKTQCEHHRDSVQTTSPDGQPLVGAYIPQCDEHGHYQSQQCHGSTGHCWCVDSIGQERAGTRTPPGGLRVDCNNPDSGASSSRPESVCERWRASLVEHYGGKPDPQQYLPQCEPDGEFSPVQCYGETTYCWCVDQDGREVPGTRSHDVVKPACLPTVTPPTARPLPRPDVTPLTNTGVTLLYAQGQKIGALPLNGTRLDASRSKTLLTLHGSIVVGIAHDCKENQVYWTDLSARTINRASMVSGAEPEIVINSNLVSPEGLAVDVKRRLMFWVDSSPDVIESANLDGSERRVLFNTDLVNPRAIIVVSSTGTLYWTDWNREAPKIESSSVDGQNRRVVVSDGIGLPNALTYDFSSGQICWADAGTKRLECVSPNGSGRKVIHPSLNYPFSMVYYRNHFYYTDWRRDGVIAVSKDSSKFTDEYLPEQRSHLYGITIATTYCLPGSH